MARIVAGGAAEFVVSSGWRPRLVRKVTSLPIRLPTANIASAALDGSSYLRQAEAAIITGLTALCAFTTRT